jgi:hypothetical protein
VSAVHSYRSAGSEAYQLRGDGPLERVTCASGNPSRSQHGERHRGDTAHAPVRTRSAGSLLAPGPFGRAVLDVGEQRESRPRLIEIIGFRVDLI